MEKNLYGFTLPTHYMPMTKKGAQGLISYVADVKSNDGLVKV